MMTSNDAGSAHRQVTSQRVALGGFLLLFVASRLLYLVLIDPNYLLNLSTEELSCGTLAQELVTGFTLPFTEYRINNYARGSLVTGVLAAGFFLVRADRVRPEACAAVGVHARAGLLVLGHPAICQ